MTESRAATLLSPVSTQTALLPLPDHPSDDLLRTQSPEQCVGRSEVRPADLLTEFTVFGRWARQGKRYLMAGDNLNTQLARWMALHCAPTMSDRQMIEACAKAIPNAFTEFRPVTLFDSSLNLPRGEVVFSVTVEPTSFTDSPPPEINRRTVEAISAFPDLTLFELKPVFSTTGPEDSSPRLLTIPELRRDSGRRHQAMVDTARRMRRMFELEQRGKEFIANVERWFETQAQLSRVKRVETEIARLSRQRSEMRWEQEIVRQKLRELRRELRQLQADALDEEVRQASLAADRRIGAELTRIRSSLSRLRKIDPIAVFTRPNTAGLLYFIGHWDVIDGKPALQM